MRLSKLAGINGDLGRGLTRITTVPLARVSSDINFRMDALFLRERTND